MTAGIWAVVADAATAPVERRAELAGIAARVAEGRHDRVLLNTCHRVELYGIGWPGPEPHLFEDAEVLDEERAVRRLLSVAAGLESAIVGEDEVLRQVRDALSAAGPSLDPWLRRIFETAIAAGRAARRNRRQRPDGLAERAVAWLDGQSRLAGRLLLVAGAGRMGSSLAVAGSAAGAAVVVASRRPEHARLAARKSGGRPTSLQEAAAIVPDAAAVAVALAGPWHELSAPTTTLPPLADLSAPPALDATVRARARIALTIDDLYDRAGDDQAYRAAAATLVDKHAADFLSRRRAAA